MPPPKNSSRSRQQVSQLVPKTPLPKRNADVSTTPIASSSPAPSTAKSIFDVEPTEYQTPLTPPDSLKDNTKAGSWGAVDSRNPQVKGNSVIAYNPLDTPAKQRKDRLDQIRGGTEENRPSLRRSGRLQVQASSLRKIASLETEAIEKPGSTIILGTVPNQTSSELSPEDYLRELPCYGLDPESSNLLLQQSVQKPKSRSPGNLVTGTEILPVARVHPRTKRVTSSSTNEKAVHTATLVLDTQNPLNIPVFKRYKGKENISKETIKEMIRKKIREPFFPKSLKEKGKTKEKEKGNLEEKGNYKDRNKHVEGYVYIFDLDSCPGYYKIGKTEMIPQERIDICRRACGMDFKQVHNPACHKFPLFERVERLVFMELLNERQTYECPKCKQWKKSNKEKNDDKENELAAVDGEAEKKESPLPSNHNEWFEISETRALEVVRRWTKWAIVNKPYMSDGKLTTMWLWKCDQLNKSEEVDWADWTRLKWWEVIWCEIILQRVVPYGQIMFWCYLISAAAPLIIYGRSQLEILFRG